MSRARASAGRRPGVARLQPSRRADQAALLAPRRYRDLAPSATPAQRQQLRRTAYHQLADARRAAAQAHAEPNRARCSLLDWEGTVTAAEQLCDAVTAQTLADAGVPSADTVQPARTRLTKRPQRRSPRCRTPGGSRR